MAKVTIYEQDNTVVSATTGTENIVYVPGYTKMGPTNKPILCNTLESFVETFGNAPFTFKKDALTADELGYNGQSLIEKSWLYATELLRAGLPVLFERVYNLTDDEEKGNTVKARATVGFYNEGSSLVEDSKIDFVAKNEGTYGAKIKITVSRSAVDKQDNITIELGDTIETYEGVSYDSESANYIGTVLSKSNLVDLEITIVKESIAEATFSTATRELPFETMLGSGKDMTYADVIKVLKLTDSSNPFQKLADKYVYDVKFITSGGYPNVISGEDASIAKKMITVAATRGEAVALIDLAKDISASSYIDTVNTVFDTTDEILGAQVNTFGAVVGPQCLIEFTSISQNVWMPGSYVWLKALATSLNSKQNPIWFPVAGVDRGVVANFKEAEFDVGSTLLGKWQDGKQCINPVMNIRAYGYCIFGNRTLIKNADADNPSALSFLNVRLLLNELKKIAQRACLRLTFENNDSLLWNKFKNLICPTLDQMKTNRGLQDYKITRIPSDRLGVVKGLIRILPIESAENFEITFSLDVTTNVAVVE